MGEPPRTSPSPKPLCPLEFRYGDPEIQAVFSEEGKLARLLEVEAALARAHARVGNVPDEAAAEIEAKADLEHVSPERVKEIEAEIKHDLMAVVEALSEACEGEAGSYVHLGATSYDIIDTANALMMREGLASIDEQLARLEEALAELAREHRTTACPGRTHGQHAVPTTFGYKMATYLQEVHRHRQRLQETDVVGKMMGAVGTGAGLLVAVLLNRARPAAVDVTGVAVPSFTVAAAVGLAFGAMLGDVAASFLKRRTGRKRGAAFPGLDQLDFVIGALALATLLDFGWVTDTFTLPVLVVVLVATPLLHVLTNAIAYALGVKDKPF